MVYRERITTKLTEAFAPSRLEVVDDSVQHRGHAGSGHHPDGETHFTVRIASEKFRDTTRLARHRMINDVLKDELAERVHALAIEAEPS